MEFVAGLIVGAGVMAVVSHWLMRSEDLKWEKLADRWLADHNRMVEDNRELREKWNAIAEDPFGRN